MINVLYCGDARMQDGLLISMLSLLKHTHEPLHLYILTARIQGFAPVSQATADFLQTQAQLVDSRHQVTRIDATDVFAADPPTANMETIFTPYCMLRLYADLIPELPDRLLYLDTDVIARRRFATFYHQDLAGVEFVGVLDHYGKWFFHHEMATFDYLNSGMLLLNLKQIRLTGLFEQCRKRCATQKMFMPDQSALNKLAVVKVIAPRRFNEQRKRHANTVFQHFTTSFRLFPWIHTLTVKPWQVQAMHDQLHLHDYDDLLNTYSRLAPMMKG